MKTKQRGTLVSGAVVAALLMVHVGHPALCAAAIRYVDAAGSDATNDGSLQAAPCATIGHAIAVASAGDTLQVAAGTYREQVSIGTSLTLVGAGAGNSIIQAPPTLPAGGNVVTIQGTGVSVDFSGFTVNGPGASGCRTLTTGVLLLFAQAGSTVSGNALSGNDIGVYSNAVGATTLSGNQIASNRYIGVFLDQGNATVNRNVVTGGNVGVLAVSFDGNSDNSVGTLTCNRIENNGVGIPAPGPAAGRQLRADDHRPQ